MADHDNGYKRLFSHPEMVADLLRGFVREEWVRDLDFSTLERVSGTYVTPGLQGRESDVVWRVRWERDRWLWPPRAPPAGSATRGTRCTSGSSDSARAQNIVW